VVRTDVQGSPLSPPPCLTTISLLLTCFSSSFRSTLCAYPFCRLKKATSGEDPEEGIPFLSPPALLHTVFLTSFPTLVHVCVFFKPTSVLCSPFPAPYLPFSPSILDSCAKIFSVFLQLTALHRCATGPPPLPHLPKVFYGLCLTFFSLFFSAVCAVPFFSWKKFTVRDWQIKVHPFYFPTLLCFLYLIDIPPYSFQSFPVFNCSAAVCTFMSSSIT
jgi:hypothetical protein